MTLKFAVQSRDCEYIFFKNNMTVQHSPLFSFDWLKKSRKIRPPDNLSHPFGGCILTNFMNVKSFFDWYTLCFVSHTKKKRFLMVKLFMRICKYPIHCNVEWHTNHCVWKNGRVYFQSQWSVVGSSGTSGKIKKIKKILLIAMSNNTFLLQRCAITCYWYVDKFPTRNFEN